MDIRVDEEQVAAAARALRALGTESFAARPDDAAESTGHAGLIDAAAIVGARHRRAALAIAAEASGLADALEQTASQLDDVDRYLARATTTRAEHGGTGGSDA